jgi:hypothetical protein
VIGDGVGGGNRCCVSLGVRRSKSAWSVGLLSIEIEVEVEVEVGVRD